MKIFFESVNFLPFMYADVQSMNRCHSCEGRSMSGSLRKWATNPDKERLQLTLKVGNCRQFLPASHLLRTTTMWQVRVNPCQEDLRLTANGEILFEQTQNCYAEAQKTEYFNISWVWHPCGTHSPQMVQFEGTRPARQYPPLETSPVPCSKYAHIWATVSTCAVHPR